MGPLKLFLKMTRVKSDIEIVLLSALTIHAITKLAVEFWPESDYDEELACWEDLLHSRNDFIALAKLDDEYVGFIHIALRCDYVEGADYDRTAYLEGIFVKAKYRNKGVANLLLLQGEQWARLKGLRQIGSDTSVSNLISQEFHSKAGFEEVNRVVCYLKNL